MARAQKEGDTTRTRRNFEMHVQLQPHLMDWFGALSQTLPGRVEFSFPDKERLLNQLDGSTQVEDPRRFDVSVLEGLLERLPT